MDRAAGEWAQRNRKGLLRLWFEALRMSGEPYFSADHESLQNLLETIFDEIVNWVARNRFKNPSAVIDALQTQQFPIRYRDYAGIILTGRRITFDQVGEKADLDRAGTLRILRAIDDAFVQLHLDCLDLWPGQSASLQALTDSPAWRAGAAERALSDQPSRINLFYNAFQYSTDGILITDLEGNVIEANRALLNLYGYSYIEVIGRNTRIFQSSHTSKALYARMWDTINRTGAWSGEIINSHKDGTEIPIFLSITPIFESGRKVGYMGVDIDLRKQKKMEERLLQSERLAVIGRMAAKVAHEIRNPLSSISLNAELLQDELGNGTDKRSVESKSLLDAIVSEVDRLAVLTEEYLQFSRLPESRFHKDDIGEVLSDIAGFVEAELIGKSIHLIRKVERNLPRFVFDRHQLRRAILNLVRNAEEAMPSGGELKLEAKLADGSINVTVEDSGCGIAPEDLDHIFEPFFTTKDFGTGLGLALTQQIVLEHGGNIHCESRVNDGTTFTIALPLNNLHEAVEETIE
jgi:PAS domain S-box-containing protein